MSLKNIALVGAGYWGKNLARSLSELGVLHSICDQAEEIRESMQKLYKDVSVTGAFESVLKDKAVAGIFLASPAVMHFEQAKQALLAGKHVFVEKPLSLKVEDAEELIKLAETQEKILFVGHILHYHPAVIKMKKIIAEGTIGKLQYIYSNRLNLGKIRTEENILWSFAP
ncbi:MAG: Gfo/Idh/MocA family oxidoreductase, partial [Victivallales bacterium]